MMVVYFEDFMSYDGNSAREELIGEINRVWSSSEAEEKEIMLNVFSVVILPNENKVTIINDIEPNEEPLVITLTEFYNRLKG
ncbi:MAG: hypothetical protein ABUK01_18925 [Leptospirales bacterium]